MSCERTTLHTTVTRGDGPVVFEGTARHLHEGSRQGPVRAGRTPVLVSLTVASVRGEALDDHDRDGDMMAALDGPALVVVTCPRKDL